MRANHMRLHISRFWHQALAAAVLAFGLAAAAGPAHALCVDPPHDGTWVNVDPGTGGVTRAVIEFTCVDTPPPPGQPWPPSWHVTLWGKCHPTDCPWGRVAATSSGGPGSATVITARYNQGFARRVVTIRHSAATNRLSLRVATDFTDPARRDYTSTYTMRRP